MSKDQQTLAKSQAGFTLVELAIVMIIIGLLIAGVLKGQELIANAKVTSTVAQIKAIDAATSTFKDTYGGLPGDLATPQTRLPNCAAATTCGSANGNGDGLVGSGAAFTATNTESAAFFPQLAAADLITGINDNNTQTVGHAYLATKIDSASYIASSVITPAAASMPATTSWSGTPSGLYLNITLASAPTTAGGLGLLPKEANNIDLKLDDGIPGTGSVIAAGAAGAGACFIAALTGPYASSNATDLCGLYVRIQG